MINCPICKKEQNSVRGLHAHMLKSHIEEYRAKGCKLSAFGITERYESHGKKKGVADAQNYTKPIRSESIDPPEDLRPLDLSDIGEKAAYAEGYRFISSDMCYTTDECREKGWM